MTVRDQLCEAPVTVETDVEFINWIAEAHAGARAVYFTGTTDEFAVAAGSRAAVARRAHECGDIHLFQKRGAGSGKLHYMAERRPRKL